MSAIQNRSLCFTKSLHPLSSGWLVINSTGSWQCLHYFVNRVQLAVHENNYFRVFSSPAKFALFEKALRLGAFSRESLSVSLLKKQCFLLTTHQNDASDVDSWTLFRALRGLFRSWQPMYLQC